MPGQPDQVVVARHDPQAVFLVPVHRVLVAYPAIVGVWIGDDVGREHVILDWGHGQHLASLLMAFSGSSGPSAGHPTTSTVFSREGGHDSHTPAHRSVLRCIPLHGKWFADALWRLVVHATALAATSCGRWQRIQGVCGA